MAKKAATEKSDDKNDEKSVPPPNKSPTAQNESGSCPMTVISYVIGFFLVCTYGVYVYDKTAFSNYSKDFTALEPLVTFFEAAEKFSPFMEFLEDDNW